MTIIFPRPLGSPFDVKELEYIAALHQSCVPKTRKNGTIGSIDITLFFLSRLGINIPPSCAIDIVRELGGAKMNTVLIKEILQKKQESWRRNNGDSHEQDGDFPPGHITKKLQHYAQKSMRRLKQRDMGAPESMAVLAGVDDEFHSALDEEGGRNATAVEIEEEFLDLVQSLSIMIIPTLTKAAAEYENPPLTLKLPYMPDKWYQRFPWKSKVMRLKAMDEEFQSLRPPKNILQDSFKFLLAPITSNNKDEEEKEEFPVLTSDLMVKLLQAHGEHERAQNAVLVDAMVEAATTETGLLDMEAWLQALTHDVALWKVGCEDRVSTHVYDIWGSDNIYEVVNGLTIKHEEEGKNLTNNEIQESSPSVQQVVEEEFEGGGEKENEVSIGKGKETEGGETKLNSKKETKKLFTSLSKQKEAEEGDTRNSDQVTDEEDGVSYRERLIALYEIHNPEKVAVADLILKKYEGRETVLFKEIEEKYRVKTDDDNDDDKKIIKEGGIQLSPLSIMEEGGSDDSNAANNESIEATLLVEGTAEYQNTAVNEAYTNSQAKPKSRSDGSHHHYEISVVEQVQSNIDLVTDSHSSLIFVITVWLFYISSTLLYSSLLLTLPNLQDTCVATVKTLFGCQLLGKVYIWLFFSIVLIIMAFLYVLPLSTGNNPAERSPKRYLIISFATVLYCWFPFALIEWFEGQTEPPYSKTENLVRTDEFQYLQGTVQIFAGLVLIMSLKEFILSASFEQLYDKDSFAKFFPTSDTLGVLHAKKAATRKLNQMLQNANELHSPRSDCELYLASVRKYKGGNLSTYNFDLGEHDFENVAGFFWTWKMILSRKLFNTEGIWISSRTAIIQCSMFFVLLILIFGCLYFIESTAKRANQASQELLLLSNSENLPQWVFDITPDGNQVRTALIPAFVISTIVGIILFLLYIPSYVSLTLKYRSGVLGSLKSDNFTQYRNSVDTIYTTLGSSLFSLIGSTVLFFVLFGSINFLFIWPFSKTFMTALAAWVVGLMIVIAIKYAIESCIRYRQGEENLFQSFYRTKPSKSNLKTLILECWFLGMGGGVLIGRLVQFILASAFWIGRVDVPFFSKDVQLGGYSFDFVPRNFVKGLLVHEAHRHPYLERLLTMYMMKLKHGPKFGTEAGACWRQLFVVALMPWMQRNRVHTEKRVVHQWEEAQRRSLVRGK